MRRRVLAGGDTGAAADARGGIHCQIGGRLWNENRVAIGRAAAVNRDISAGGNDSIERASVDDQVFYDGEGLRSPWFDRDRLAVLEFPHVQLADCGTAVGP